MFKEILFRADAREKILKGVNTVADAVATTLGPRGQNVIFEESSYPTITKDGVTVAQQVMLEDKFENMGVMIAREAAENTNREAGDGTTSTVVLLRGIANECHKYITAGMNPILLKRGMDAAVEQVTKIIDKNKKNVTSLDEKKQVATISANNDPEIGDMIARVIEETGTNGIVTVTNSNSMETEIEYVKGTKLDRGYASHMFINNNKMLSVEVDNPTIILTTDKINMESQLVEMLQTLLKAGKRKFVLVAGSIEGPALAFLTQNHLLGKFTCVPVSMPSFGDYQRDLFYDLAAATESTVLGEEESIKLKDCTVNECGTVDNVVITRDSTVFTGANGDVSERISGVNALLEKYKDAFLIEQLKKRLGRLNGSIANIRVGGASETEQTEIKYRIEDALNATKSATEDGIVEGGGVALVKASNEMTIDEELKAKSSEEFIAGWNIVRRALVMPCKQIMENAGLPSDAIIAKIKEDGIGYNALTNEYQNLFENGVIDPVRCVKNELANAVATSGTLLTSNVAITVKPTNKE
jgi:chaperonin GroEL